MAPKNLADDAVQAAYVALGDEFLKFGGQGMIVQDLSNEVLVKEGPRYFRWSELAIEVLHQLVADRSAPGACLAGEGDRRVGRGFVRASGVVPSLSGNVGAAGLEGYRVGQHGRKGGS